MYVKENVFTILDITPPELRLTRINVSSKIFTEEGRISSPSILFIAIK